MSFSWRNVNTKIEIQLRTVALDFWATWKNKINYNIEKDSPDDIQKELIECAKMTATLDDRMMHLNERVQAIR